MRALGLAKILCFYGVIFAVAILALWRMDRLATLAPPLEN